jgi:hypothetical protein
MVPGPKTITPVRSQQHMIEQDCITRLAWTEERVSRATTLEMVQALNNDAKQQQHKRKTSCSLPSPRTGTGPGIRPQAAPPVVVPPDTAASIPLPNLQSHAYDCTVTNLSVRRYQGLSKRISHKQHVLTLCISPEDEQRLHTLIQQEQHLMDQAKQDMVADQERMRHRVEQLDILLTLYTTMSTVDENEAQWKDNDMSEMTEIQETIHSLQVTINIVRDILLLS